MKYGSRKFIAALLSLASAHWALVEQLITGADYKALVLGTVGLYLAGNVAQQAVQGRAAVAANESGPGARP